MKLPPIHGYIDRRMLINFTADADVVRKIIPPPFGPKIYKGKAIVGICLIRLKSIKPKGFPDFMGINSENGAHRIAVEWEEEGQLKEGVYIPRRDTSLPLNAFAGGKLFPGKHHFAKFEVEEKDGNYKIAFKSEDGTCVAIEAKETTTLNSNSIFENLENVSAFFEAGAVGYSPYGNKFQGIKLKTYHWMMKPLQVLKVQSSFFENENIFPKGSIQFDNAMLMTKVEHEWIGVETKQRLNAELLS